MEIESTTPSVFISSTVKDFSDLRSAIAYALRTQGYNVYQSDAADFNIKGDRSAFDECFTNIKSSDFFILIIGSTTGNLFEDDISITRQEYRIARDAFMANHKPRLLLFLRRTSELALRSSEKDQINAGIDDAAHLESFIEEVQLPGIEGVPSFLQRFLNFEDLMSSLVGSMNLGRNLSEKIIRHALLSELLSNLSLFVEGENQNLFPQHWFMKKMRFKTSTSYHFRL